MIKSYIIKALRILYTIWCVALFAIVILGFFPLILLISYLQEDRANRIIYFIIKHIGKLWFLLCGIYWVRKGEKPSSKESYVYVINHGSYLDAAILFLALQHPFRALAKFEMEKIPIFGTLYKVMTIGVDRSSPASRAASVQRMLDKLRKGVDIVVFPEGTFKKHTDILLPFFNGAFRIAIETQTAIIPILIEGVEDMKACKEKWWLSTSQK
jgi:1-acyl-sn-glycerol-3-phosphate acyltransferase